MEENRALKKAIEQLKNTINENRRSEDNLLKETEKLKSLIDSQTEENKKLKNSLRIIEEKSKQKLANLENSLKQKYSNKENQTKQIHSSEINKLNFDIQRLNLQVQSHVNENKALNEKLQDLCAYCDQKKSENEKLIDMKNVEYDNLLSNIQTVKTEMHKLEKLSEEKSKEFQMELEIYKSEISKLNNLLEIKQQELDNKTFEYEKIIEILDEKTKIISELEGYIKNREEIIKSSKAEINNLVSNANMSELKIKLTDKNNQRAMNEYEEKLEALENEKNSALKAKQESDAKIKTLSNKISEMNKNIAFIKNQTEEQIKKLMESSHIKLKATVRETEEVYKRQIHVLENVIKEKQSCLNDLKIKYDNKKHKVNELFDISTI